MGQDFTTCQLKISLKAAHRKAVQIKIYKLFQKLTESQYF